MNKLLKGILIFQALEAIVSIIFNYSKAPVFLILPVLISLLISLLILFLLYKGTNFVVKNPESDGVNFKVTLIRWLLSFYFSIFAIEVGLIFSFIVRFFMDSAVMKNYVLAVSLDRGLGPAFYNVVMTLGILMVIPLIYKLNISLKFIKPKIPTFILTFLWLVILLLGNKILNLWQP